MKQVGILICSLILLLPIQSKAIICTNENKVRLQTLAQNINISYDYQEENGGITFRAILTNIHEDLIIEDVTNGVIYKEHGNELIISNLKSDKSYRFDIKTEKYFCHHEKLYTHYLNTPSYNPYYQDEVCHGVESYTLCNKWQKITTSYEVWKQKVEDQKNSQAKEEPIVKEETKKGIFDYIIDIYIQYYYIILPLFILSGIVIIYRHNKKEDLF